MKLFTRLEFMDKKCTYHQYYGGIATEAGLCYKRADPNFLRRIKEALASGDEHLNTIPLIEWDRRAKSLFGVVDDAFRKAGDVPSLAGQVCLLKWVANEAVKS